MKKIIALILAMILAVSLVACGGGAGGGTDTAADSQQEQQQEEKQEEKQDEPVKPVVKNPVRSELYDDEGNILADISYEYDEQGRKLSNTTSWNYGFGEGWEKDSYTYNADGTVAKMSKTYDYSDYAYVISYEYDAEGRLIKEAHDDGSYGTRYVYGDDGKLAESYSFNGDSETLWRTYSYAYNAMVQTEESDDTIYTYATFYDDEGRTLKWEYAWNGQLTNTHNYSYDADGNLTKQEVSIESWQMEGYVLHYYE